MIIFVKIFYFFNNLYDFLYQYDIVNEVKKQKINKEKGEIQMARREKRKEKQSNKTFRKIFIVAVFLICILFVLKYAYNYVRNDIMHYVPKSEKHL